MYKGVESKAALAWQNLAVTKMHQLFGPLLGADGTQVKHAGRKLWRYRAEAETAT